MPKIRGFKADLWTDEDFVELSTHARLLWMGMWNYACDNGHLADKPKQIKMRVLPTDDVSGAELLRELEANRRIVREKGVITIPNFKKHQKPDKRYFQTCDVPGCARPDASSQPETRGGHTSPLRGSWGPHDEVNRGEVNRSESEGSAASKTTKRATSLSKDFAPNDTNLRVARERGVDVSALLPQFIDFHTAKGTTYKDWHAALNTWIRRERPSLNASAKVRRLPHASELELPPDGLSVAEYDAWDAAQRAKRAAQ